MKTYSDALAQVRAEEEAGNPTKFPTCFLCGHIGFYYPADRANDPGHVYSEAGLSEWKNTFTCEYCFDEVTRDPDMTDEEFEAERIAGIEAFERAQFLEAMEGIKDAERNW